MRESVVRRAAPLGALVLSLSAAAQQAPPDSQLLREGIRSAVEVRAMDLDVVATGRDGQPVNDLRKEDFAVRVDGREVPVDYFTRVEAGTLHGPDLGTASPDLILETIAGDRGDRYLARQFVLFFDDEHLTPFERNRVIESLRDFVDRLTPSDRVSILSYGASNRVIVPFTSSKEDLYAGLSRLEKVSPGGLRWENDFRRTRAEIQRVRPSTRSAAIRSFSQQVYTREKSTLEDLRRAVAALAARSGKRTLILVSNGLELHPGQILGRTFLDFAVSQWDYSVVNELNAVVSEANRAGITVHALDAKGITSDVDASETEPGPFSSFFLNETLKEPLAELSRQTGGILVANRNAFKPSLDRIYRDASTYYSVGVTLANVDSQRKEHKVEVTTTRPGVTVRARRTYSPKSADEAMRDRMEMALLNPEARGEFPVTIAVGVPKKGGGLGRRLAPYEVRVPFSALTFQEQGGKRNAVFEVSLAAVKDNGDRSGFQPDRQTVTIPDADWARAQGESFRYRGEMKTLKGNFRFVATVRDVASDRIGIGSTAIRIE